MKHFLFFILLFSTQLMAIEPADRTSTDTVRTEITTTTTPAAVVTRLNLPARSKVTNSSVISPYLIVQKTFALYWEGGVGVDYTHQKLADERLHFSADYLSSRLGSAWGSNALKQDYFSAGVHWHSWQHSSLRWVNGLKGSYFTVDYEDDEFNNLPSSTILVAFETGMLYTTSLLDVKMLFGVHFFSGNGSTIPGSVFPVYSQLSVLLPIRLNDR